MSLKKRALKKKEGFDSALALLAFYPTDLLTCVCNKI